MSTMVGFGAGVRGEQMSGVTNVLSRRIHRDVIYISFRGARGYQIQQLSFESVIPLVMALCFARRPTVQASEYFCALVLAPFVTFVGVV